MALSTPRTEAKGTCCSLWLQGGTVSDIWHPSWMDVTSVTLEALKKNPFSPYRMQSEERGIFFFFRKSDSEA